VYTPVIRFGGIFDVILRPPFAAFHIPAAAIKIKEGISSRALILIF
jgi:hypothetical protein